MNPRIDGPAVSMIPALRDPVIVEVQDGVAASLDVQPVAPLAPLPSMANPGSHVSPGQAGKRRQGAIVPKSWIPGSMTSGPIRNGVQGQTASATARRDPGPLSSGFVTAKTQRLAMFQRQQLWPDSISSPSALAASAPVRPIR